MNAPEKIYLQVCGDCKDNDCDNCKFEDVEDNVTWCMDKIFEKDIQYTRTDAFIEKAEKFLNNKFCDVVNVRVSDTLTELTTRQDFIEHFRKYMEGEES